MSLRSVDFARPARAPLLGWWLLAIGTATLAMVVAFDRQVSAQHAQLEARLREHAEAERTARLASLKPVAPTAEQLRMQRVAPQLREPWIPVLRVIENVTESPIFLIELSVDPAKGLVRIDAEAPTFEHALAYTQLLDEPDLLGPAQLRSHEPARDATGQAIVRFSVQTPWVTR